MDIFIGALIFSVWSVTLFFGKKIGLSMLLFAIPITFFIIHILEENKKEIDTKAKILVVPITLLAGAYCIFNNDFFNKLNILVIPLLVIYMILELLKDKIEINLRLIGKIIELALFPLNYIGINFGKLKVYFEVNYNIDKEKNNQGKELLKGIIIIFPIVLIIICLLASADMVFGNIVSSILKMIIKTSGVIDFTDITVRMMLIFFAFVYFMCFFDYIVSRYEIETDSEEVKAKGNDYAIKMVLGILNVIYLIFCIIQIKSLFLKDVNINYAEYARRGFFQLMWVSLINLVTILIAKKAEKREGNTYIVSMCLVMILFTFIILVSSAVRMYYYESAYGYTLLRLLVYCSLFTEAILLVPTIMYVMDVNIDLIRTYIAIITTIYVGMNFMNFDNMIAKKNIDRYFETGKIDMFYLENHIGTDAIKQMVRLLEIEPENDMVKHKAEQYLVNTYKELKENSMDFRDFNFSKFNAKELIEEKINFEDMEKKYVVVNRY